MARRRRRRSSRQSKSARRTRKAQILLSVFVFLIGAAIFLYPLISNMKAEYEQQTIIKSYDATVTDAEQQKLDAALKVAEEYNKNLFGDSDADPFEYGSETLPDNYEDVLNLNGNGVMGYIEIPKIDVYIPIYHGTDSTALENGAGHLEGSTLPIGGEGTNAILSAHRGLPEATLFTNLDELEEGDEFYIHILGTVLAYSVDEIDTIEPDDFSKFVAYKGEDHVTLLTCTPYGINTQRLLVRGTRIEYVAKETEIKSVIDRHWLNYWGFGVYAGVMSVILIFINTRNHRKKHRKRKPEIDEE